MAENVRNSSVAQEIKKEYLKEHLDYVRSLIGTWVSQLNAPPPLAPQKDSWGWQSVYRAVEEIDPDNNHMIRRHLRSRTLWTHHAEWERNLDHIYDLQSQLGKQADRMRRDRFGNKQWEYHEDYLGTTLWKGFEKACGRRVRRWYDPPHDDRGAFYGSYRIELSVGNAEERANIEQGHWELIRDVAELKQMKELAELWGGVLRLQEQMQAIVGKALKSNDILYPCRFCKHLWK